MESESSPSSSSSSPEDELFERLLIDAQYVDGDSGVFNDGRKIPWLNMKLAQSGQAFFQKYYTSIIFAHVLNFGMEFGFKPVTSFVIKTQSYHGDHALKTLIANVWHILRWYEHDLIGVYSEGYKAVTRIRKTHEVFRRKSRPGKLLDVEIAEDDAGWESLDLLGIALKKDLDFLDTSTFDSLNLSYDPPEPISQSSLAMMQISFLLPVMAHPKAFGIEDTSGVEGFEHLWALIGHLLGIEDKFNIPLLRPGKEFYVRFWEEVWLPSFLVRDSKIATIQQTYFRMAGGFLPLMSAPASTYFYLSQSKINGFNGVETYKLLSFWEKFCIVFLSIVVKLLGSSAIFRTIVNWLVRKIVRRDMDQFHPEEHNNNQTQLTKLPTDMEWSLKYEHDSTPSAHQKWMKVEAMLGMMTTAKIRWKKRLQKSQK